MTMVPCPSDNVSLDTQRSFNVESLAQDLWTCNIDTWLDTYAPRAARWDAGFVNNIVGLLKTSTGSLDVARPPVLDDEGWKPIYQDVYERKAEDQVFAHLETISLRIVTHAIDLAPELSHRQRFTLKCSPCENTYSEVVGWVFQSELCGVQRSPDENDSWNNFSDNVNMAADSVTHKSTRASHGHKPKDSSQCRRASNEIAEKGAIGAFKIGESNEDRADVSGHKVRSRCCSSCKAFEE